VIFVDVGRLGWLEKWKVGLVSKQRLLEIEPLKRSLMEPPEGRYGCEDRLNGLINEQHKRLMCLEFMVFGSRLKSIHGLVFF